MSRTFFYCDGLAEYLRPTLRHDSKTNTTLENIYQKYKAQVLDEISTRNATFVEEEITKLDSWADDLKESIERSIKELDKEIRQVRKDAKLAPTLEEKLELQKQQKKLETQRNKDRRELFDKQDEVDARLGWCLQYKRDYQRIWKSGAYLLCSGALYSC